MRDTLMTYLNAGVIALGLLFGFWAEYGAPASAVAQPHGVGASVERWHEE